MSKRFDRKRPVLLAVALALAGCAPSPEELMKRAEASLNNGDARSAMIDLKSLLQKDAQNAKARALLGDAYVRLGDVSAAEIELEKAKEAGAPADLVLLPSCRVLVGQAKFDETLEQCKPDAGTAEQRLELQLISGQALLGSQRTSEAKAMFQAALAAQPDNLDALLGLATATQAEAGVSAAKAVLDGGSDNLKKQPRFWLARAGINMMGGDFAAAESDYRLASERATGAPDNPDRIMALGGLAEAQVRQGNVAAADETSGKLLKLAPNHPLVKQLRAQIAAAGGKIEEARTLLEEVVAGQPQNHQARTLLAVVTMQQGNYDQAQMHLQQVVAHQPQNARAQRLLAEVRVKLGAPEESLAGVRSALDDTQNSPELLAMAGRLSLASGDKGQALTYLAAATKSDTKMSAQTQLELANGYLMAGETDRALEILESMPKEGAASHQRDAMMLATLVRKGDRDRVMSEVRAILQRSPDDAGTRNLVGGVYAAIGKPDLAREQFKEAVRIAPNESAALINIARLDLSQNKHDAAEQNFKRVLEKEPKNLIATLGMALAANVRKDAKTTEKYLLKAREEHPDSLEAARGLGEFYLANNEPAKARAVADDIVKDNPRNGEMANVRGMILLGSRDVPGAIASFEEAVRLNPKSAQFVMNLARAKLANRDVDGALKVIDGTLAVQPKSALLLALAGATALQAGRTEKAAGYIERLRAEEPEAPATLALEAELAFAQKRYKDALSAYRKASARGSNTQLVLGEYRSASLTGESNPERIIEAWLEKNPGDVAVAMVLAEKHRGGGNTDGAVAIYEAALATAPDNVLLLNNLATLYDGKGSPKAVDYASRAYKAAPRVPAIADTYGWILFKQGKTEQALPLIKEAAKGLPDNAEVQYHLAALLAKTGDKTQAVSLLNKAIKGGQLPTDQKAEAQALLNQLSK